MHAFKPDPNIQISFLGSGPDRGRSPVEWGDFPFVRSSPPLGHPARLEAQPARPAVSALLSLFDQSRGINDAGTS